MSTELANTSANRLLSALPQEECELVAPDLQEVSFDVRDMLYESNAPLAEVYFPLSGVFSMLDALSDMTVEVATIGNEGMVGLPAFLGGRKMPLQVMCQIPGPLLRLDLEIFREWAERPAPHRLLQRYTQALMTQVAQGTACNRAHSNQQRAARWLLQTEDRVGGPSFPLTHEFLAQMLGVRRATVTETAGELQRKGLINYQRGTVNVVDRRGLESASCECYRIIRDEYDRLLNGDEDH